MTTPARLVHNNHCDRCKRFDLIPRSYGFLTEKQKGYNFCSKCANEWENFIRGKMIKRGKKDWHEYVDKLLTQFVENMRKEKVSFT